MSVDNTWRADTGVRVIDLPNDFEQLKELALAQGWIVTRNKGNGHWKFVPPKGQPCYASGSPSDTDWLLAFRRRLKQNGLKPNSLHTRTSGARTNDSVEYFTMPAKEEKPPQEKRPMVKKVKYGALKEAILHAIDRMASKEAYPEDIIARVQAAMPNMDLTRLKVTMNGYVTTGTLTKNEIGRYGLPAAEEEAGDQPTHAARVPRAPPAALPPPASEEDLKVLETLLTALADAERVVRKHIDIQRQLGALSSMLGRQIIQPAQIAPTEESQT